MLGTTKLMCLCASLALASTVSAHEASPSKKTKALMRRVEKTPRATMISGGLIEEQGAAFRMMNIGTAAGKTHAAKEPNKASPSKTKALMRRVEKTSRETMISGGPIEVQGAAIDMTNIETAAGKTHADKEPNKFRLRMLRNDKCEKDWRCRVLLRVHQAIRTVHHLPSHAAEEISNNILRMLQLGIPSHEPGDELDHLLVDALSYAKTGILPGRLYDNCTDPKYDHPRPEKSYSIMRYRLHRRDSARLYSCISCRLEHAGVRHWAMEGFLIGIARNQTFIPWDNDLDMGMVATDSRRLVRFVKELKRADPRPNGTRAHGDDMSIPWVELSDNTSPWRESYCQQCQGFTARRMRGFYQMFDWHPHIPTADLTAFTNTSSSQQNYLASAGCNAYPATMWHREEDVFPLQRCRLRDISAAVPECGDGSPSEEYTVPCPSNIDLFLLNRGHGKREGWIHPKPQALFKRFMDPTSDIRRKFVSLCQPNHITDKAVDHL